MTASPLDATPARLPREARATLVRAIGRWDLTAAVVNGVIGSAIFGMPARQAELTGALSPLAYLAAGVGVLAIVLCFAEVASRFRDPGGPYLYAREAFGPFVGFQAGWLTFWIRVTAVAANLNVFVEYLSQILPAAAAPAGRAATMVALVVLLTGVNVAGVREATWTVNVFTLAKLLPLLLLVALGAPRIDRAVLATQQVTAPDWGLAILLLMFAYGGFEAPLIPAGEARDPRKDSGFALLAALAIIASVYMLVQLVVVGVVPRVAGAPAPVAAAFRALIGPAGATLASVAAMVSIYGYATGSVLQSPRVLYSMAERGELPRPLARVHARFRTPDAAILVYAALCLGLALYGGFQWNALLSATVRLFTYGLTCVALPVLRRRRPDQTPGFRLPLAGLIAPAGAAFCAVLFCFWLRDRLTDPATLDQSWVFAAIVALGVALWWARRRGAVDTAPEAGKMA